MEVAKDDCRNSAMFKFPIISVLKRQTMQIGKITDNTTLKLYLKTEGFVQPQNNALKILESPNY